MRLDKFLKNARIIKRRTLAKTAADSGRITVNGRTAKAGTDLAVGDQVTIAFGSETMRFEVVSVEEVVKKDQATSLYRVLGDQE